MTGGASGLPCSLALLETTSIGGTSTTLAHVAARAVPLPRPRLRRISAAASARRPSRVSRAASCISVFIKSISNVMKLLGLLGGFSLNYFRSDLGLLLEAG